MTAAGQPVRRSILLRRFDQSIEAVFAYACGKPLLLSGGDGRSGWSACDRDRPEILLFDEPCFALDPISTAHVEPSSASLQSASAWSSSRKTVQQAARVADVTASLYLGALVEVGKTEQIFGNPKDPRTGDYVTRLFGGAACDPR